MRRCKVSRPACRVTECRAGALRVVADRRFRGAIEPPGRINPVAPAGSQADALFRRVYAPNCIIFSPYEIAETPRQRAFTPIPAGASKTIHLAKRGEGDAIFRVRGRVFVSRPRWQTRVIRAISALWRAGSAIVILRASTRQTGLAARDRVGGNQTAIAQFAIIRYQVISNCAITSL